MDRLSPPLVAWLRSIRHQTHGEEQEIISPGVKSSVHDTVYRRLLLDQLETIPANSDCIQVDMFSKCFNSVCASCLQRQSTATTTTATTRSSPTDAKIHQRPLELTLSRISEVTSDEGEGEPSTAVAVDFAVAHVIELPPTLAKAEVEAILPPLQFACEHQLSSFSLPIDSDLVQSQLTLVRFSWFLPTTNIFHHHRHSYDVQSSSSSSSKSFSPVSCDDDDGRRRPLTWPWLLIRKNNKKHVEAGGAVFELCERRPLLCALKSEPPTIWDWNCGIDDKVPLIFCPFSPLFSPFHSFD